MRDVAMCRRACDTYAAFMQHGEASVTGGRFLGKLVQPKNVNVYGSLDQIIDGR